MKNVRCCPICETSSSSAKLFLNGNVDSSKISSFSFASRKEPEFMCHQLVQCPGCDLVYANDPPDQSVLAQAYSVSDFDSSQEADDAAAAYGKAIRPVLNKIQNKDAALEIGTGTGIFLEELKNKGFKTVLGVEPSAAAISAAPIYRQAWIRQGVFQESEFQSSSFDLVCCFMTLEHVIDPHEIISAANRLLRPGGAIVLVTHNYRSGINRFLGRRSPIIDIEHMQLFSPRSIRKLLERAHFDSIDVYTFHNCYALRYWIRLLPVAGGVKQNILKGLNAVGLANIKLSFNVGNIMSIGFRRANVSSHL